MTSHNMETFIMKTLIPGSYSQSRASMVRGNCYCVAVASPQTTTPPSVNGECVGGASASIDRHIRKVIIRNDVTATF